MGGRGRVDMTDTVQGPANIVKESPDGRKKRNQIKNQEKKEEKERGRIKEKGQGKIKEKVRELDRGKEEAGERGASAQLRPRTDAPPESPSVSRLRSTTFRESHWYER